MTTNTPNKPQVLNTPGLKSARADLRQDIAAIKEDISGLAHHALEAGIQSTAQLREQASERYDELKDVGVRNMVRLEKRIRERPGQSLAIAFATGALLSLIFGRK